MSGVGTERREFNDREGVELEGSEEVLDAVKGNEEGRGPMK
jgi:hypothetical protein